MTFTLLRHTHCEAVMQAVNRNFWILSAAWKSRTTLSLLDQALQLSRTVLRVLVEPRLPWAAVPTCSSWPWTPGGTDALPSFLICPTYIHHLLWKSGMEGHDWDGHYWDVAGLSKDWRGRGSSRDADTQEGEQVQWLGGAGCWPTLPFFAACRRHFLMKSLREGLSWIFS